MLGGERGLRAATMTDIARFTGNGGFGVHANLVDDTELAISFNATDSNRHAKIDGDNAALSDLATHLRIIWLTPKEDRLFVDSVSDRRAFFDRMVASFDAPHAGRIARLAKLLSERAMALKLNRDDKWLVALEIQIAETAIAIAAARIKYAGELNYFLDSCAVSVTGIIEAELLKNTAMDTEKSYLEYLANNRGLMGDKMVIDGAHKSDFGIFNKNLNLPTALTSTGQQKSVLVDLIIAHAKLVYNKTGRHPLILLDEAIAHLDDNARCRMFSELRTAGAQVWSTGLDSKNFTDIPDTLFVTCQDGTINNILAV